MKTLTLCSVLTVFLLTACDASAPTAASVSAPDAVSVQPLDASPVATPTPVIAPANFTGTFHGTETGLINGYPYSNTITLNITISGTNLSGTWSDGRHGSGSIAGSIASNDATVTMTNIDSCTGNTPAVMTISGNQLSATIVGSNDCGSINISMQSSR